MPFERTAARLWRRLAPEERIAAATSFWEQTPQEVLGPALAAVVRARHLRPQFARSLPPDQKARALGAVLDPGEPVAASLLVALHLGHRRRLLATFLDAVGLPHEDGILKEEEGATPPPLAPEAARRGLRALDGFPPGQVATYFNTLWLQDPERWAALETSLESA